MYLQFGSSSYPIVGEPVIGPANVPPFVAEATVAATDLSMAPADYAEKATIRTGPESSGKVLYQGWVVRAAVETDNCRLSLEALPMLGETQIDGWSIGAGMKPEEMFYTVAQLGGLSSEKVHVQGFNPPEEPMLVAVPVDGLDVQGDIAFGGVVFTSSRSLPNRWGGVKPPPELADRFSNAAVWGTVELRGRALLDVELRAFELIQAATDAMAVATRYSRSFGLDGEPRSYDRRSQTERIRLRPAIGIRGLVTPRRWIRGLVPRRSESTVAPPELMGRDSGLPEDRKFRDALAAFRRAVDESDRMRSLVALSDVLELYGAGISVQSRFSRKEVQAITAAAQQADATRHGEDDRGLRDAIIGNVLKGLHRPDLMDRVVLRMERDGVPHSPEDVERLRRIRRLRGLYSHGGDWPEPDYDDVQIGRALVGRLLLWAWLRDSEKDKT